jgi:HAE1 family hydrophobic/amphiphilic exporter-1
MDPPQLRKINPADAAILYLALSAERLPLTALDAIADSRVAQRPRSRSASTKCRS